MVKRLQSERHIVSKRPSVSEGVYLCFSFKFFLAAAWLALWPVGLDPVHVLASSVEQLPGLPQGDQAFFLYALWWVPHALFDLHQLPWYSHYLGAPEGVSLLYTTLSPFLGVALSPISGVHHGVLAYNLAVLFGIALFSHGTLLVAREWGASRYGALLAGIIVFYPPALRAQLGHLNIFSIWVVPITYYCYLRLLRIGSLRAGLALGLAVVVAFYTSAYHTIHIGMLIALDSLWRLGVFYYRNAARSSARRLTIVCVGYAIVGLLFFSLLPDIATGLACVFVGGLWLGLFIYRFGKSLIDLQEYFPAVVLAGMILTVGVAPFFRAAWTDPRHEEIQATAILHSKTFYSAQPLHYLLSPRVMRYWIDCGHLGKGNELFELKTDGEFAIFPGYAVWGLLVLLLILNWRRRKDDQSSATGGFWAFSGIVFVLLSFGPLFRWGPVFDVAWSPARAILLPAIAFDFLPMLDGYRVFARMGMMVLLCLAVGLGCGWSQVLARMRNGSTLASILLTVVAGFCLLSEHLRWPNPSLRVEVPAFYEKLSAADQGPLRLCEFPTAKDIYLLPQTVHRQSVVNVYQSRSGKQTRQRTDQNLFLYILKAYDFPWPQQLNPPADQSAETLRRDFERSGVDGIILHPARLNTPADAAEFDHLFTRVLGLEKKYEGDELLYYSRP